MLRPRTKPTNLIHGIDQTTFSVAMAGVAFTLLTTWMIVPTPHHGLSADLVKVGHPSPMPRANREDAIIVAIMRDGKVFFRTDYLSPDELPAKIRQALRQGSEKNVYIRADARAKYGTVKEALDGIRDAGIENVSFLADQKRTPAP